MKRIILAAFVTVVILVAPAAARQGVTLSVSPTGAHVGDHLFFSGCGYGQNKALSVWAEAPGSEEPQFVLGLLADAQGCFDTASLDLVYNYDGYEPGVAGTYEFYVFYKHGSGVSDYGSGQPVSETYYDVSS